MLSGRPDPALSFDETVSVLRKQFVGKHVSVSVWLGSWGGLPAMSMHGWCVRLDERPQCVTLVIRDDRSDTSSWPERIANTLRINRDDFRRAGEAMDAEELGPLAIEFADHTAIVSMRDSVLNWPAIHRPG